MILCLINYLFKFCSFCNIYFSVVSRAFFSFLSSLLIAFLIGVYLVPFFKKKNVCQVIRNCGPKLHFSKGKTPTMGGIIIICSIVFSILLWSDLCNRYVWYVMFILISYGVIGFLDDYYKIVKQNSRGLNVSLKYCLLSIIAVLVIVTMFILEKDIVGIQFTIPFFKNHTFQLGMWYILLGYFVIVGTSNAVNLSDGLDGLVIVPVIFIASGLCVIALVTSNVYLAGYLDIQHVHSFKELVIICSAIVGSGLGFLWFNIYPAQIFMGDIGSLSLGGTLAVIAILLRKEFLLLIMGGLFVLETLSVIVQVLFFKLLGYRIFRMAPLHHHFELKGYLESHIVVRFWIITFVLVLSSLIMLKVH